MIKRSVYMIGFICGILIGGFIGVFFMCLLQVSKN